ncbi:hypothetical protein [Streptomyces sp. NPDC017993]|uniref:hypothetical protein n=1 Tax=Streptomyces sp. NPDC017993 TaxID=3365027 RepID=UPI00378D7AAC
MTDPSEFYLTEDQLRERFEERVKDFVFSGYEPQEQPVMVLLGGQPADSGEVAPPQPPGQGQ